ncbi:MAG: hypothetical protein AB7T49_10815 [Oligoflexales bacterium]
MRSLCYLPIVLSLAFVSSCKPRLSSTKSTTCGTVFLNKLDSPGDFDCLSREVEVAGTMQRVIKLAYDRRSANKQVYFFNTQQYEYHYNFVNENLGVTDTESHFNQTQYSGPGDDRQFVLGSLVLYTDVKNDGSSSQKLLFEMWDGDEIETPYMEEVYQKVKAGINPSAFPEFFYHPISDHQLKQAQAANGINIITTEELYAGREFLALNPGEAVGYLTYVNNSTPDASIPCTDITNIVVFEKVPNDLGLVAGVVTATFQTPLSHINVKSKNRGTANMSLKNAGQVLAPYFGKPVRLKVAADKYEISELPAGQAGNIIKEFWAGRRPHLNGTPQAILNSELKNDFTHLGKYLNTPARTKQGRFYPNHRIPRGDQHKRLVQIFGAKATNLGVIETLFKNFSGVQQINLIHPETLGIPFDFYEEFMNTPQTGLDTANPGASVTPNQVVKAILDRGNLLDPNQEHSICQVKGDLSEIRAVISRSQVPPRMLALFKKYLMDDTTSPVHISKTPRIRLRSSTNSEDLEGFTGAGLYNSEGVSLYKKLAGGGYDRNSPKPWAKIEADLKEVVPFLYSSVWNDRAFEEREWYSINGQKHLTIKVGLAFHAAYPAKDFDGAPGEVANGVMVTRNIYAPDEIREAYINGQHYDLAITNPPTVEELEEVGEDPSKPYITEEITTLNMTSDDDWYDFPRWSYGVLRRSSVKNGEPVLKDDPAVTNSLSKMEIRSLAFVGQFISDSFADMLGYDDPTPFAIDIEWKLFGPKRRMLIKQARPFELAPREQGQGLALTGGSGSRTTKKFTFGPRVEFKGVKKKAP